MGKSCDYLNFFTGRQLDNAEQAYCSRKMMRALVKS